MRSVMNHNFSQVPKADIPRSTFDRSHGYKTTFNSGDLVPILADEVLPGDTFNIRTSIFARLATPLKPIMDNLFLETFYFFVPLRLLWDNFQHFMGERDDPDDDPTDYLVPQITVNASHESGSLTDYLGLPLPIDDESYNVAAWWHRGYNKIYADWFKDQNFINNPYLNRDDGPDNVTDYTILKRCKRHDYFTSALPWPQKGPDVLLPIGSTAPVYGNGKSLGITFGTSIGGLQVYTNEQDAVADVPNTVKYNSNAENVNVGTQVPFGGASIADTEVFGVVRKDQNVPSGIYADLESATAATINDIRQAFQLQRLYERDARGGSRYVELLKSHFNVVSPDFRLQRSEFLGSSSTRININPVQQTSANSSSGAPITGQTPSGALAAYGVAQDSSGGFVKSFTEHGIILGIVNVRADLTYQRGIPRMFSRLTKVDHYWPALAHLGEQEILNKEIFAQFTSEDEELWGYQERWAEYRYFPSQITGKFRSTDSGSLDVWHLSQDFGSLPELGTDFILEDVPINRIIAVKTEPEFLLDVYFDMKCARAMPVYSVPGLVDHF